MYLAIKEIKHSKAKYLSIILVIALISWLIFLSSSLTEGLSNGNRQEVDRWDAQSIFLNEASNNTISASFIEYKETEDKMIISGFSEESSLNLSPVTYLRNTQFQDVVYSSQNNIVSAVLSKDDSFDLSIQDFIKEIPGYTAQNLTLNTLIYFLFTISTAIVGIFMYIITIQKISLFGVLKAQGVQNKYLASSVFYQSLVLSTLGLILGLTLTLIITSFLPAGIPYKISFSKIGIYSVILLIVSLVGSIFSVVSVVKIDATKAIG